MPVKHCLPQIPGHLSAISALATAEVGPGRSLTTPLPPFHKPNPISRQAVASRSAADPSPKNISQSRSPVKNAVPSDSFAFPRSPTKSAQILTVGIRPRSTRGKVTPWKRIDPQICRKSGRRTFPLHPPACPSRHRPKLRFCEFSAFNRANPQPRGPAL